MTTKELGDAAERAVEAHLRSRGFAILARNWRGGGGELDLVARKDGIVRFVEVRARGAGAFAAPAETIDARKRERLRRAAEAYLAAHGLSDAEACFDVAAVVPGGIDLIEDAF